jgi:hypothetical protein
MARTPNSTINPPSDVETPGLPALVDQARDMDAVIAQYNEERDLANRLLGQVQAMSAVAKLTTVVGLQKLAHIKQHKLYRALAGKKSLDVDGNEIADVGTWDGFCVAIGCSRQKVDEDLMNLAIFGEEALAQLSAVGAGYRELRKLRKLPENERLAIAKAPDKESLLELIDDLAAKHAAEKAALEKAAADARADYEAQQTISKNKQKRIDELERETARIAHLEPDQRLEELRQRTVNTAGMAEVAVRALGQDLEALRAFRSDHPGTDAPILAGLLANIEMALIGLKNEFGIEDAPVADERPEWVRLREAGQL